MTSRGGVFEYHDFAAHKSFGAFLTCPLEILLSLVDVTQNQAPTEVDLVEPITSRADARSCLALISVRSTRCIAQSLLRGEGHHQMPI